MSLPVQVSICSATGLRDVVWSIWKAYCERDAAAQLQASLQKEVCSDFCVEWILALKH